MKRTLRTLMSDVAGQSMAEYGLLAALIAAALVITINALRTALENRFTQIRNALQP